MKRIVDFSDRKDGDGDTTGNGPELVSSYIVALAFASNSQWRKLAKLKKLSKSQIKEVTGAILKWCFPDSANTIDDDKINEKVEILHKLLVGGKELQFEGSGTVNPEFGNRVFRAGPILRSVIVHLGIATFKKAKIEVLDDAQTIYPESLDINFVESWAAFPDLEFNELPSILQRLNQFQTLVLKVNKVSFEYCIKSTESQQLERPSAEANSNSLVEYGHGRHILFYGPPGTGKTREANRLIQAGIVAQIETSSSGEITRNDLSGPWGEKRNSILKEIRKFVAVTQFHATYGYEDFIEGLRPLKNASGDMTYEIVDGIFLAIWRKATGTPAVIPCKAFKGQTLELELDPYFIRLYDLDIESHLDIIIGNHRPTMGRFKPNSCRIEITATPEEIATIPDELNHVAIKGDSWSPENQYFLLVDEINRGKVSKILGELLFAMAAEREDQLPQVRTQYSKTPLLLPSNLHIIATMNTCDKSVDVLDQAIKRRFELHELMPLGAVDLASNPEWKSVNEWFNAVFSFNAVDLLLAINNTILDSKMVDYDRQIGHSYFFKVKSLSKQNWLTLEDSLRGRYALFSVYFSDIFPVLQEFFIDSRDTLAKFVPKNFLDSKSLSLTATIRRTLTQIQDGQRLKPEELEILEAFESNAKVLCAYAARANKDSAA
jgi:hypothetical protein